jgi:hypothetical protein
MGNKALATHKVLTTYLNDHLAGSVAALEILDHLIDHLDHPRGGEWDSSLAQLRREIEEDQEVLRSLLKQLGGRESPIRKAAAWLSEKMGEVKLRLDDPGNGEFQTLEALEALCLGIQGKLALWRALGSASSRVAELRKLEYVDLQRRGTQQFEQADALRLEAARAALVR